MATTDGFRISSGLSWAASGRQIRSRRARARTRGADDIDGAFRMFQRFIPRLGTFVDRGRLRYDGRLFEGRPMQARAVITDGKGNFSVETIQVGDPQAGEGMVEIRASGVCHTDHKCLTRGAVQIL